VCEIDTTSMTCIRSFDFGNPVRAVDFCNGSLLVGLRNGTIVHVLADNDERKEIMHSHCDGEVWGLQVKGSEVITTGDDNQILFWDTENRCRSKVMPVTDRKEGSRRGGASTLSNLSPSQCSRAVTSNDEFIIAAGNDGAVNIYPIGGGDPQVLTDSTEWIEVMRFSPDGKYLAVGSHDNNIYIYDAQDGFSHVGTMDKHNSFIVAFDWDQNSQYIRSNCGAHELLFFTMPDCQQDPNGASNTTGVEWATKTVKFGWHVDGIFPKYADGTHVNGVCGSSDGALIATGDDYGLVNIFRDPVRNGSKPRSYRGHSEHVVRVAFNEGNDKIFSIGGYDQTLMQWRKC
jgi:echinoderm microtubule-associated protein-like 1/2